MVCADVWDHSWVCMTPLSSKPSALFNPYSDAMGFDHDHQVGPRLAAALVNAGTDEPLGPLLEEHEVRRPALDAPDVQALRAWAGRLRQVFAARAPQDRCTAVNTLLADVSGSLYLSMHDDTPPHLHLAPDDHDVVARVRSVTAGGLAFFVAWAHGERLGLCARERCSRAYVDVSRAGRQRYCSARCGNADAVARHRAGRSSRP